jgi:hypothetical protein
VDFFTVYASEFKPEHASRRGRLMENRRIKEYTVCETNFFCLIFFLGINLHPSASCGQLKKPSLVQITQHGRRMSQEIFRITLIGRLKVTDTSRSHSRRECTSVTR